MSVIAVFDTENEMLRQSWDKYDHDHLDTYLVSGVEDPRINCQSILTRSLLVDTLWPDEFTDLIDAELRFGTVMTWILAQLESGRDGNEMFDAVSGKVCNNGLVTETFDWLQTESCPIPDYISAALIKSGLADYGALIGESALNTFREVWRAELADKTADTISVLEPACGSANDFRFLNDFGLAKFIEYSGFDISEKNVENANMRFPNERFFVGSILDSGLPDDSFDYVVVHDLFEHLSIEGLQRALDEVRRIARKEAWLHFFNVADIDDHIVQPVDQYYWNTLSLNRLTASCVRSGAEVQVVPIPELLRDKFCVETCANPNAVTILMKKA
jgi:SAM-dependent methyltransferase